MTAFAYRWTRLLDVPFWALFNILIFILHKEMHVTPLQIAWVISLKPTSSILAVYWSSRVHQKPEKLVSNIVTARFFAFFPFLWLPWFHPFWYILLCSAVFMFLQTGIMPAWMELLKQNVPLTKRDKLFSRMQTAGYVGSGLFMIILGKLLDHYQGSWTLLFQAAALLSLVPIIWQRKMLVSDKGDHAGISPTHPLLKPWKNAFSVLGSNRDFAKFQIGFFLLGSGLMILQPSLPLFLEERVHLNYLGIGMAINLCKGIGFSLASPFWCSRLRIRDIFSLTASVAFLAFLFPFFLSLAEWHAYWVYGAYLLYGLMQSGSELCWNMSGPIFSEKEDSSPFSSVNILSVGIRGVFIPSLGALILSAYGPVQGFIGSAVLLASAGGLLRLFSLQRKGSSYRTSS